MKARLLLLLAFACSEPLEFPEADLVGAEQPVRDKIHEALGQVRRTQTADTWGFYGAVLDAHGYYKQAEQAYLRAAALAGDADAYKYWHLAGNAAYDLAPERAFEHFGKALSLHSDYLPTHLQRAALAERLDRHDVAEKLYKHVASRVQLSHAFLGLGRCALAADNAKAALVHLQRAGEINPKHKQVFEALARTHHLLGNTDESKRCAALAGDLAEATLFPDPLVVQVNEQNVQSFARLRRARGYMHNKRDVEAIAEFRAALEVRPRVWRARVYLAQLLHRNGEIAEARREIEETLEGAPADSPEREDALALQAKLNEATNK